MYLHVNVTYCGKGWNLNEQMHNFLMGKVSSLAIPCIHISYI